MNNTLKLIELIEQYGPKINPGGHFLLREYISNYQLLGAVTTYAKGVNPDAIIGMVDDTISRDGKEGIVFSTLGMYFSTVNVQSGAIRNAMIRYQDIAGASVINKKLSDLSGTMRMSILNLPYEYYDVNSLTVAKTPFVEFINSVITLWNQDQAEFESDRKPSDTVVKNYLYKRDIYFQKIYESFSNKKIPSKIRVDITDAFGFTPMHYCIAMAFFNGSYGFFNKTIKANKDVYIEKQPFGPYNYCMDLAIKDSTDSEKDYSELFSQFSEYKSDISDLVKQRNKLLRKEALLELGKKAVDMTVEGVRQYADKYQEAQFKQLNDMEESLEERYQKELNSKDIGSYHRSQAILDKKREIERRRNELIERTTPSPSDSDYYEDEYSPEDDSSYDSSYEDIDDSFYDEGMESVSGSDEITATINTLIKEYFDECVEHSKLFKDNDDAKNIDPRASVVYDMMTDEEALKERLFADHDNRVIIEIKYKYFMIPREWLKKYPNLEQFVKK